VVVKGCAQKKGNDFSKIFSTLVKISPNRVILGLAVRLDLELEQLDVKNCILTWRLVG